MSSAPVLTGGCLCRAVRFEVRGPVLATRQCWCRLCQYLAAGSATNNLFVAADALAITGTPASFRSIADSGNAITRRFCPTCGTPLFVGADARPTLVGIRMGALDDPEATAPAQIIWADGAPCWAVLDPDLPRVERQPAPIAST